MNNPLLCNDLSLLNDELACLYNSLILSLVLELDQEVKGLARKRPAPPPLFLKKLLPPILLEWKLLLSLSEVTRAEIYQPSHNMTP